MTTMHRCYVSNGLAERTFIFGNLKCKWLENNYLWGIVKGNDMEPTAEGTTESQR